MGGRERNRDGLPHCRHIIQLSPVPSTVTGERGEGEGGGGRGEQERESGEACRYTLPQIQAQDT